MSEDTRRHAQVVVGLERGAPADRTLTLAADEAERRGIPLAVVTITRNRPDPCLSIEGIRRALRQVQSQALSELRRAADFVSAGHSDLPVLTFCLGEAEVGPHREPLDGAEVLVIGTSGRYGRQALSLQSASRLLLTGSRCPVLVVPDRPRTVDPAGGPRSIVVGVSEHPADAAVVRAAYAQLGDDDEIVLLHAYSRRRAESPDQADERARDLLAGHLNGAPSHVRASAVATEDEAVSALLSFARTASLLVIGGRTGALSGLVRASVSRAVLEVVPCPLLAVPRVLDAGPPAAIRGLTIAVPDQPRALTTRA